MSHSPGGGGGGGGKDCLRLVAIAAVRLAGEIVLQSGQPLLGMLFTVGSDHRGNQSDVIGVLRIANADPALPFRIGQLLIGDFVLLDALL
jgi:hypothetical protein